MVEALILVAGLVALFILFLPALIAFDRKSPHRVVILIANVAIGWTGVGWLAVLAVSVWPRNDALPVRLANIPPPPGPAPGSPVPEVPTAGGGPRHPPETDAVSRLSQLAELKDAGVLSDTEFTDKKRQILASM